MQWYSSNAADWQQLLIPTPSTNSPHAPLMLQLPPEHVAVTPPVMPGAQAAKQLVPPGSDGTLLQLDGQPSELGGLGAVRGAQPEEAGQCVWN